MPPIRAGLAAVALLVAGGAAGTVDDPAVFFTAPQANARGSPSDPSEVSVSANGRYVAFTSFARLAVKDTNECADIYVLDRVTGRVTLESLTPDGHASSQASGRPHLAGDGRLLIYETIEDAHGAGLPPRWVMVLRDRLTGATRLLEPAMSGDGGIVAFQSDASDLFCGRACAPAVHDINLVADVFVFDRAGGVIRRVSTGRTPWMEPSIGPAVDAGGTVIAFSSRHPTDARDDRDDYDLFIRVSGGQPAPRSFSERGANKGTSAASKEGVR